HAPARSRAASPAANRAPTARTPARRAPRAPPTPTPYGRPDPPRRSKSATGTSSRSPLPPPHAPLPHPPPPPQPAHAPEPPPPCASAGGSDGCCRVGHDAHMVAPGMLNRGLVSPNDAMRAPPPDAESDRMSAKKSETGGSEPPRYEIRVGGALGPTMMQAFP